MRSIRFTGASPSGANGTLPQQQCSRLRRKEGKKVETLTSEAKCPHHRRCNLVATAESKLISSIDDRAAAALSETVILHDVKAAVVCLQANLNYCRKQLSSLPLRLLIHQLESLISQPSIEWWNIRFKMASTDL